MMKEHLLTVLSLCYSCYTNGNRPEALCESYEPLYQICERRDIACDYALQILSLLKPNADHPIPSSIKASLLKLLQTLALDGTPLQSKFAIRSIHQLYSDEVSTDSSQTSTTPTGDDTASKTIRAMIPEYIDGLRKDNHHLSTVLSGFGQIASLYPHMFQSMYSFLSYVMPTVLYYSCN